MMFAMKSLFFYCPLFAFIEEVSEHYLLREFFKNNLRFLPTPITV